MQKKRWPFAFVHPAVPAPSPHLGSLHFENGGPIQKDLVTAVDGRESVEIDHSRHNLYGVINAYDVALVRESVNTVYATPFLNQTYDLFK